MQRRLLLPAGLLAPAAGSFWGAAVLTIFFAASGGAWQDVPAALSLFGITWAYGGIIAFVLTWTVGLAWHAIACAAGWRSLWAYSAAGAFAGASISVPFLFTAGPAAFFIFWLATSGLVVSVIGWLLRRPDLDAANPATPAP